MNWWLEVLFNAYLMCKQKKITFIENRSEINDVKLVCKTRNLIDSHWTNLEIKTDSILCISFKSAAWSQTYGNPEMTIASPIVQIIIHTVI